MYSDYRQAKKKGQDFGQYLLFLQKSGGKLQSRAIMVSSGLQAMVYGLQTLLVSAECAQIP